MNTRPAMAQALKGEGKRMAYSLQSTMTGQYLDSADPLDRKRAESSWHLRAGLRGIPLWGHMA